MTDSAITTLVTTTAGTFSSDAYTVLVVIIGIGLAFLLFRWGWRKVKNSMNAGEAAEAQRLFHFKK